MDAETALRELCAGWERLDAAGVAALFAPDGVYEGPLFEAFPVGPDAVLAACTAAFADLAEVHIPLRHVGVGGDVAMGEGTFAYATPAGERAEFPLVMVAEVRDGLLVRFTEYFDTAAVG